MATRGRSCDTASYTARLEALSERRASLTRKLAATRTELARAARVVGVGVMGCERPGVEGCTECMRDVRAVCGVSDTCARRLYVLRRKLEAVVDELEWLTRKFIAAHARNIDAIGMSGARRDP